VFERNLRVWNSIKKPSPGAFFENLLPYPADGFARQAFVLCWMMLPRGKRDVKDVAKVMQHLFERNLAGWDEEFEIFTKGFKPAKAKAKPVGKKVAKKAVKRRKK
jgi:hypothetical protein